MVSGSLSILSSTSSFASSSSCDSSPPYAPTRRRPFKPSTPSPRFLNHTSPNSSPQILKLKAALRPFLEDESAEQFLQNNTIADFMRFKPGVDGATGELQTAVVRYRKRFPWSLLHPFLQVDLVSTIHIADTEYFESIQRELEPYDCVLYEMVASRESLSNRRNPTARKRLKGSQSHSFNIIGFLQKQISKVLELDFQLDCLNYSDENWYHADLDFETFRLLQLEKGENMLTFARDMTLRSTKALVQPTTIPKELGPVRSKLLWASRVLPMPLIGILIIGSVCVDIGSQVSEYPELKALARLDFGTAMKFLLAKRLTTDFTLVTADVEEKSVIIGERNKAAMEALRRAMEKGHNRIAVLYGGGHMPDLGRRLKEELELVPSRAWWITAWSIRNQDVESSSLPFLKTIAKLLGWPLNRYQTLALLLFSLFLALDLWFWELFFGTATSWVSIVASKVVHSIDNVHSLT